MAKTNAPPTGNTDGIAAPPASTPGVGEGEFDPATFAAPSAAPAPAAPVQITRTDAEPNSDRYRRNVVLGQTVYITDAATNTVHPAIVTHVNDEAQSIVATVFKPNECAIGVGFLAARGGLAAPGCWHEPFAD